MPTPILSFDFRVPIWRSYQPLIGQSLFPGWSSLLLLLYKIYYFQFYIEYWRRVHNQLHGKHRLHKFCLWCWQVVYVLMIKHSINPFLYVCADDGDTHFKYDVSEDNQQLIVEEHSVHFAEIGTVADLPPLCEYVLLFVLNVLNMSILFTRKNCTHCRGKNLLRRDANINVYLANLIVESASENHWLEYTVSRYDYHVDTTMFIIIIIMFYRWMVDWRLKENIKLPCWLVTRWIRGE